MITVEEAQAKIRETIAPGATEMVGLAEAHGRVLAEDVKARLTQPPVAVSAMDGYAVRAADTANLPVRLALIGESAAGKRFSGIVQPGQAVRIFTGAPVPTGADTVIIQEDTEAGDGNVTILDAETEGRHIRVQGLDFTAGQVGLTAGTRLSPRGVGLAAAMNSPWLRVYRRPRVVILATGTEIVLPGDPVGPDQIVSSNSFVVAAMVAALGGEAFQLGVAQDDIESLQRRILDAKDADLIVTLGGASVGDHDLVQAALKPIGLDVDFWKIAMRPGKPLMFGRFGTIPVFGLPGNPVSSYVCSLMYLVPALERLQGLPGKGPELEPAISGSPLSANGKRQDFMRCRLHRNDTGAMVATPASAQDSSMMGILATADGLIVRPVGAPAAAAGDPISIIRLNLSARTI